MYALIVYRHRRRPSLNRRSLPSSPSPFLRLPVFFFFVSFPPLFSPHEKFLFFFSPNINTYTIALIVLWSIYPLNLSFPPFSFFFFLHVVRVVRRVVDASSTFGFLTFLTFLTCVRGWFLWSLLSPSIVHPSSPHCHRSFVVGDALTWAQPQHVMCLSSFFHIFSLFSHLVFHLPLSHLPFFLYTVFIFDFLDQISMFVFDLTYFFFLLFFFFSIKYTPLIRFLLTFWCNV